MGRLPKIDESRLSARSVGPVGDLGTDSFPAAMGSEPRPFSRNGRRSPRRLAPIGALRGVFAREVRARAPAPELLRKLEDARQAPSPRRLARSRDRGTKVVRQPQHATLRLCSILLDPSSDDFFGRARLFHLDHPDRARVDRELTSAYLRDGPNESPFKTARSCSRHSDRTQGHASAPHQRRGVSVAQ